MFLLIFLFFLLIFLIASSVTGDPHGIQRVNTMYILDNNCVI